jgi:predicted RNase H-like HicB family nuclease
MDYIAIIHKDPGSDFGVSFPDFPGCITAGHTVEEAKEMALEALTGHMEVMRETGDAVPDPSSLDQVMSDPQFSDGIPVVVTIETHHVDRAAAGQKL